MNAPELDVGNAFYYVAFNDLASCRNFETGMVPWDKIVMYVNEHDIHGDQREMLFEVIRGVDVWYMNRQAAKVKKETADDKRSKPLG